MTQGEEITEEVLIAENAEPQELEQSNPIEEVDAQITADSETPEVKEKAEVPKDVPLLDDMGFVSFNDVIIAKLVAGQPFLEPKLELIGEELNQEETAILVHEKLAAWLKAELHQNFAPLYRLKRAIDFVEVAAPVEVFEAAQGPVAETSEAETSEAEVTEIASGETVVTTPEAETAKPVKHVKAAPKALSEPAKEIARLVLENHGAVDRQNISGKVAALTPENRRELRIIGIRFGRNSIYLPLLLKPKSARLSAILGFYADGDIENKKPYLPPFGVTSFELPEGVSTRALDLIGFKNIGGRAVRLDIIDRIIDALFEAANLAKAPFVLPTNIVSFLGTSNTIAEVIVESLGWEKITEEDGSVKWKMLRVRPKPVHRDFSKKPDQATQKRYEPRPANSDRPKFDKQKSRKPNFNAPRDFKSGPKTIDADSPFAVLAALRASLESKKD